MRENEQKEVGGGAKVRGVSSDSKGEVGSGAVSEGGTRGVNIGISHQPCPQKVSG